MNPPPPTRSTTASRCRSGAAAPDGRPDHGWRLALVTALQTTLDPGALVTLFSARVNAHVPHTGLRFAPSRCEPDLVAGNEGKNRSGHRLALNGAALGEITFSREEQFSSAETMSLNNMLAHLAHPLRNALAYQEALIAAARDPLTGAHNRAGLDSALPREVELARRHGTSLSIVMIDVDRFKTVNDQHGHLAGDAVLKGLAARTRSSIRSSDLLFRFGGDELAVLASNTPLDGAVLLAGRIRAEIAAHHSILARDRSRSPRASASRAAGTMNPPSTSSRAPTTRSTRQRHPGAITRRPGVDRADGAAPHPARQAGACTVRSGRSIMRAASFLCVQAHFRTGQHVAELSANHPQAHERRDYHQRRDHEEHPQSPSSQSTNAPEEAAKMVLPAVPIEASSAYCAAV